MRRLNSRQGLADLRDFVAGRYDISPCEILSPCRQKKLSRARHIGFYLARTMAKHSFPEIGRAFNRDHTSVVTAVQKMEARRLIDAGLDAEIDDLRQQIESAAPAPLPPRQPIPPAEPAIRLVNRVGNRYGRLIVLSFAGHRWTPAKNCRSMWRCRCDCGGVRTASVDYLSDKRLTQSCGCIKRALARTAQERGAIAEAARAAGVSA